MSSHSSQLTLVGKPATTTPRPCSTCFTATTSTDRGIVLKRRLHVVPHVAMREATGTKTASMKDMALEMKRMRGQMEDNKDLAVLMAGLRGKNLSQSDFAENDVQMQLLEMVDGVDEEQLPQVYSPAGIQLYWGRRPVAVCRRITQLLTIGAGFLFSLGRDALAGTLRDNAVVHAIRLRGILTSLGPAYIKLGQALSIRPDVLPPAAMVEMQKLCDKVPSFDSGIAMAMLSTELGRPWTEVYAELTPEPVAAASLGQVYKGRLHTGEAVAVKVQRPYVLETVTVDLYILRELGTFLRNFPKITARLDLVALLDEWAARFFEELDYIKEGQNGLIFADQMREDLPQVVVPRTFPEYTSRRVLTTSWLEGEKLSQSRESDVGSLVNLGVICYLKQLLETGFFHADPHPGNLIRTPDGRLAILDFGLMTQVDEDIRVGMIEAVSHLIHRDYEAIVQDFVTLGFIPPGTNLSPILPVLSKVFDQALEGGGAKNINFQGLSADLAQITFDYPFRIPPYFALIIRAIGVLEGIALVGDPDFALVDEAFPYIAKRLMTDNSPRLRAALRYMIYGKSRVFDSTRLIDLLDAYESFTLASKSAQGNLGLEHFVPATNLRSSSVQVVPAAGLSPHNAQASYGHGAAGNLARHNGVPASSMAAPLAPVSASIDAALETEKRREALRFLLSPEGSFFREFLLDEIVKTVDAATRTQLRSVMLAMSRVPLPPFGLPGANRLLSVLAPQVSPEDEQIMQSMSRVVAYLSGRDAGPGSLDLDLLRGLEPQLASVAARMAPDLGQRLLSRVAARALRRGAGYD
ncbi:AKC3 [Auxenochlorella protothecoides x Auxenochlorella symbiontica]